LIKLIITHTLFVAGSSKVNNSTSIQGRGDKVPSKNIGNDSPMASGAKASAKGQKASE
jgi:hypothetical protein